MLEWPKTLKEVTMEAIRLRTSKAKKLIIEEVKAKLKILAKEDV